MNLLPEEEKYLSESKRCDACGHLDVFHNDHCCSFCNVPQCLCKWGIIEDEGKK